MVAVMYVENSRSVVSIQCKRKLCPVILPWIINKIDSYIWMNCCVSVDDLLEQLVTAPLPKLYGDVFSVIDLHAGVIFERISEGSVGASTLASDLLSLPAELPVLPHPVNAVTTIAAATTAAKTLFFMHYLFLSGIFLFFDYVFRSF